MPDYPGDWLPRHGWKGFSAEYLTHNEEELWTRYFREYLPARDRLQSTEGPGRAAVLRAEQVAAALAAETNTVRRVARWRRHFPTEEWEVLRRWLTDEEIRQAFDRLRNMGVLHEPHWIIQ